MLAAATVSREHGRIMDQMRVLGVAVQPKLVASVGLAQLLSFLLCLMGECSAWSISGAL